MKVLLDKRLQDLVEDYVPQGEIFRRSRVLFFDIFGLYKIKTYFRAVYIRNVRFGYSFAVKAQSDHRFASAAAS